MCHVMFRQKVHVDRKHIWDYRLVIDRKFDLSHSNTAQKVIVSKLISKTFLFTIDQFNKCMEFIDN